MTTKKLTVEKFAALGYATLLIASVQPGVHPTTLRDLKMVLEMAPDSVKAAGMEWYIQSLPH